MASLITKPDVIEFVEMLSGVRNSEMKLEDFPFNYLDLGYRNLSIRDLDVKNKTGSIVIAIKRENAGFSINPDPDVQIYDGDTTIILGTEAKITNFKNQYCSQCKDII